MRVLVVASGHPTASRSCLLGIFEWDQALALHQRGIDVTFFAFDLRSLRRRRPLGYTHGVEQGVEWHSLSLPVGNVPKRLLCFIGRFAARQLYKKVYSKNEPPQIIHAHFGVVGNFSVAIKRLAQRPLVITEHNSAMNGAVADPSTVAVSRWAYAHADKLLAVSGALAGSIKRLTGYQADVVPNMVDTSVFDSCLRLPHDCFRVTTVSNLIPLKNTISLVKAVQSVHSVYSDIRLDVVGDGPLMNELFRYVEDNNLGHIVTFHGRMPRENIAKLYEVSDCMAMVSQTETFGVVYIEAMSAGLPVIATRCGGPDDIVTDSTGILVDIDNQAQLVAALVRMYNTGKTYYDFDAIKKYANDNFSGDVIASRLIDIYNQVAHAIRDRQ